MLALYAPDPEATHAVGARLGRAAGPGTVIALIGDLGAGKTLFAKGVGAGLDVPTRVQSPTFVLVAAHPDGRLPLWHADLYRLGAADELEQVGLDEVLRGDGVVLIEWADRFPEILPSDHVEVTLVDEGEGRRITILGRGAASAKLVDALA